MMFRIAPASLAVLAIFNVASTVADTAEVDYTVRPFGGAVISDPKFVYGGSGCGTSNHKCSCDTVKGELQMKGKGSDDTDTGLTFSCKFKVKTPNSDLVECSVYVDVPFSTINHLWCKCPGYEFYGCYIPDSGDDFTKTIALMPNDLHLLLAEPPSAKNGDVEVEVIVKPIGAVISDPEFVYGGSGCGGSNAKCSCQVPSVGANAGNLLMVGEGTEGTATGLDFSCDFYVRKLNSPPKSAVKCSVHVDIPYYGTNHLSCVCAGYTFYGCDISSGGQDFTKTNFDTFMALEANDPQLDETRCEPLPPSAPSSPPEIDDCSGLTDNKKCKIKVKKCKKNLSSLTKKCLKKCQKDLKKKMPLCQMTCCKLGVLPLSA